MSKAFSLLEVLIAMAIITIGLVAALSLIAFSLRSYKTSSQQIIDANKVQGCLEQIRNLRDAGEGIGGLTPPICLCDAISSSNPYKITCWQNNTKLTTYLYDWK